MGWDAEVNIGLVCRRRQWPLPGGGVQGHAVAAAVLQGRRQVPLRLGEEEVGREVCHHLRCNLHEGR